MKPYKLHYTELDIEKDPIHLDFKTFPELVDFAMKKTREQKGKVVFLIAKDYSSACPFVTDNPFDIEFILEKMPGMGFKSETVIFEHSSFEDAYVNALLFVEEKELCYKPKLSN
jgi:hypothetical protein